MSDYPLAGESPQFLRLGSDAYKLTVRQSAERGKAFAGPKEKDRKPLDPPPFVQLTIRDPEDPASNYLQSPYFFMCCSLRDADLDRPGQLAAAQQGDDIHNASQAALTGSLSSSLHRLKDVDNTDAGFFVFPDISIRIEGHFRLLFSLFEIIKNSPLVNCIKSELSEPFTVYSPRTFPGMAESTFLSRSFADQGVKLRIRKEPRVLGDRKRPAPSDGGQSEGSQPAPTPQPGYGGTSGYDAPPSVKRQKHSSSPLGHLAYDQDSRSSQRSFNTQRDPYTPGSIRDAPSAMGDRSSQYAQQEPTTFQHQPDYQFTAQRHASGAGASTFDPQRGDFGGYTYHQGASMYQNPRDAAASFTYPSYHVPHAVPADRQLPSSVPSQQGGGMHSPYPRGYEDPALSSGGVHYPGSFQQSGRPHQQQQAYQGGDVYQRSLPPPLPGSTTGTLPSGGGSYGSYAPVSSSDGSGTMPGGTSTSGSQSFSYRGRPSGSG